MATSSSQSSLGKDLAVFAVILVIVLSGIVALYFYEQNTGQISVFSSQLFAWLID